MKKLLLGTAIATVLATASYAQNALSIPDDVAQTAKALQDGMIDDDTPDPGYPNDLLNGGQGQGVLADPTTAQDKSAPDPEEELIPGTPLPKDVATAKSYPAEIEKGGVWYWWIVTRLEFADGHIEWREYNTNIPSWNPAPEPPPLMIPSATLEDLNKALEGAPGDLLNGKPDSDGDQPALSDPKTAKQPQKAEDNTSENSRSEASNNSDETAPRTEQKSQSTERQSETKPNDNAEKSDDKPIGNSEHSNPKSASTSERANAKPESNSEHAARTVAHEKPEVSQHVAHTTEAGHMSGMHEGGMREAGMHMGGLAGMHASGLGGLGGMHLGSFGGMHLGGFGRL